MFSIHGAKFQVDRFKTCMGVWEAAKGQRSFGLQITKGEATCSVKGAVG